MIHLKPSPSPVKRDDFADGAWLERRKVKRALAAWTADKTACPDASARTR